MRKNQKTNSVGSCVPHDRNGRVVLVGMYRDDQLAKWRGWYNYPISGNGEWGTGNGLTAKSAKDAKNGRARTPAAPPVGRDAPIAPQTAFEPVANCDQSYFSRNNELWLFKGTKDERRLLAANHPGKNVINDGRFWEVA